MPEYIKRAPKKAVRKAQKKPTSSSNARQAIPKQRASALMGRAAATSPGHKERLVAEAVEICHAAIASGAMGAATGRAAHYAGEEVWTELTHGWIGRNCRWLARLARTALEGKDWLHARVGSLAAFILAKVKAPETVRLFGAKAAEKIPLPLDEQLIAVARGMQIAGIVICVMNGRDAAKCACLVDLVTTEGKQRLKTLIQHAAGDWAELHNIAPAR